MLIVAFDNSPDRVAIELKYGEGWKRHFKERICHQHCYDRKETMLTSEMNLLDFVNWLKDELEVYISDQQDQGSNIQYLRYDPRSLSASPKVVKMRNR